jgi:hypothetical protein
MSDPIKPADLVSAVDAKPADAVAAPAKPEPRRVTRKPAPEAASVAAPVEPVKGNAPEKGSRVLARLRSQIESQAAAVEEAKLYKSELTEYAKGSLEGLSKEQRAYVEKMAGDNPAKLLATVRELRAAGLLPAPGSAAPANTTPKAPAAPAGSKPGDNDDAVLVEYERLKKLAPTVALDFKHRNEAALKRALSQRTRN